jgi:hypothetical protein
VAGLDHDRALSSTTGRGTAGQARHKTSGWYGARLG